MNKKEAIEKLIDYENDMKIDELSERTIAKYLFDVRQWLERQNEHVDREAMIKYKEWLYKKFKSSSVNSKIVSINRFLKWAGYNELLLKTKRIQAKTSIDNTISKNEYKRMLEFAQRTSRDKMYYIMRTIAVTGIRIDELKYITVSALKTGKVEVYNKGKYRHVYISKTFADELLKYCYKNDIHSGIVFYGRDRFKSISAVGVWKNMKYIATQVGVPLEKVYPHSFRHLFARTYMERIGDITELSDLLGHSRLETTWIYTKTTSDEKRSRLEKLEL